MKILIADDHALFRDGLSQQLKKIIPNANILHSSTYSQTIKALDTKDLNLIILDLEMPDIKSGGFDDIIKKSGKPE